MISRWVDLGKVSRARVETTELLLDEYWFNCFNYWWWMAIAFFLPIVQHIMLFPTVIVEF